MAPTWFSIFLENELVFLTNRLTLCLIMLLNRSLWLVFPLSFPPALCLLLGSTAAYACQQSVSPTAHCRYTGDRDHHNWRVAASSLAPTYTPTICLVFTSIANQIPCFCFLFPTNDHLSSHSMVSLPGLGTSTATWCGTWAYFWFTSFCNPVSDTPAERAMPASDSFSTNKLAIRSLVSGEIVCWFPPATNW